MNERTPGGNAELSRRLFGLLGIGAAGSALVACQATSDGGAQGERTEPADDEIGVNNPERVFHGGMPFVTPPAGHFNMVPGLTQQISLGLYQNLTLPSGGLWNWADEEWLYLLVDSFEFTETEFVYNLKPDLLWSDGSDITARDVEATFWLRWLMNQQEWPMIAGLSVTGDLQVTFELDDPSTVFERRIMKAPILPAVTYGEFADRARSLFESGSSTDSEEAQELNTEVQEWRPEINEESVLASGPFNYDFGSISGASIALVKNSEGLFADQVGFERIVIYNGETEDITPLVLDGTIDYATHAFPISTQQEWEANGVHTKLPGIYNGTGLTLSIGRRPEFGDPLARQALACAIDKHEATVVAMDVSGRVSETMSGMASLLDEQWLDDDVRSELDPYEFDQDRAASLFEEAGWTRRDGRWLTPQGDAAEYQITFQSDQTNRPVIARYVSQQLGEFGIQIGLDGIDSPNLPARLYAGQFDIITSTWGAGEPHPHYAYSAAFIDENEPIARSHGGRGMDYDLVREIDGFGEVDIAAMVTESGEGLDEERQRELINQLALIFNRELPKIPIWERFGNNPCQEGVRILRFPDDDDPIWASGAYTDSPIMQLIYRGELQPS